MLDLKQMTSYQAACYVALLYATQGTVNIKDGQAAVNLFAELEGGDNELAEALRGEQLAARAYLHESAQELGIELIDA